MQRMSFDFETHLQRQREWSERTFGPDPRAAGICDHIRKELLEVEAKPTDLSEWIDVVILGLDGAWRAGHTPAEIIAALVAKQDKNESREWPDWRTAPTDKAIEHDRSKDAAPVFKVGDRVRIARKVLGGTDEDLWVSGMDRTIGQIGTIAAMTPMGGSARVGLPDDPGGWYYPLEALDILP
jgi:hypothetical protein